MAARPLIALRATPLMFPAAGVAHYIRSLATELRAAGENITLFTPLKWNLPIAQKDANTGAAVSLRRTMFRMLPRPRQAARAVEAALLALNSKARGVALYHEPATFALPYTGPTVLTVHDLSWMRFPETHPVDRRRALERDFPLALKRANRVLADSQFVKAELVSEFGLNPSIITTAPLAARSCFRPGEKAASEALLQSLGLRFRSFFLSVGTLEPRKNLVRTLRAFAQLPPAVRRQHPLVLVGAVGWNVADLEREISARAAEGELIPLGYMGDEDLACLYSAATAVVYMSLYEGFGLPPLEAMASGTPVVASNVSSIPEVVGDAGLLIDPFDESSIRDALLRLVEDEALWADLAARGVVRSSGFSWFQCAAQTRDVYNLALAQH